jgi:transcriptional regulator of acetoin/glycerol metabolism
MPSLPHELRILADRLSGDDARLLWRAATQLELLYASMGADPTTMHVGAKADNQTTLKDARRAGEKAQLSMALSLSRGVKAQAARRLNISRPAFYKALKKCGLL